MGSQIWYENIHVLFDGNNILDFWPTKLQSYEQKFNAITRFILYGGTALSIYYRNTFHVIVSLVLISIMALLASRGLIKKENYKSLPARHNNPNYMKRVPEDCTLPTDENPFGNILINEYVDNPTRPPACPVEDVENEMKRKFVDGLYRDVGDVYEKENSQRQFFTMPNTSIPNDQASFAKWLFFQDSNCKNDKSVCTGFEVGPGK